MSRRSLTVFVLVVLAGVLVATAAGFGYGNGMMGTGSRVGMMRSDYDSSGPGMMNGSNRSYGYGMMGSNGYAAGMMNGSNGGYGMMGGLSISTVQSRVTPAQLAAVRDRVEKQLTAWGYKGFTVGEIMAFSNNDYVLVKDAAGRPAFELLADPGGRRLTPEPGPNRMWNTSYGMMRGATGAACGYGNGMMGGASCPGKAGAVGGPPITASQAKAKAAAWLAVHYPGRVTADATALPGYYTIDVTKSGGKVGMLSVNASTGAVWYHTWHGHFLADQDF